MTISIHKPKSNYEAIFKLMKAHYVRPDGQDRDWEEYKPEVEAGVTDLCNMLPENAISRIVIFHTSVHHEVHAVMEIDREKLPHDWENTNFLDSFCRELSGDANCEVGISGVSDTVIYYYESY